MMEAFKIDNNNDILSFFSTRTFILLVKVVLRVWKNQKSLCSVCFIIKLSELSLPTCLLRESISPYIYMYICIYTTCVYSLLSNEEKNKSSLSIISKFSHKLYDPT